MEQKKLREDPKIVEISTTQDNNNNDNATNATLEPLDQDKVIIGNAGARLRCRWFTLALLIILAISVSLVACYLLNVLLLFTEHSSNERLVTLDDECKLIDELKLARINYGQHSIRVPSSDFRTLVRLVATIDYYNRDDKFDDYLSRERYMPLILQTVTHIKRSGDDGQQLVLATSCAKITLNLARDLHQLVVTNIDLETVRVGKQMRECQVITTAIKLNNVARFRYSSSSTQLACANSEPAKIDGNKPENLNIDQQQQQQQRQPMRLECATSLWLGRDTFVRQTVAHLIVNELEFELEGREETIRGNEFSKQPEVAPVLACGVA